jgi:hypothetical protein
MPAYKHIALASDRKVVTVFRQKMLSTNSSSNGINTGYIACLILGLNSVKKVIENCRIMIEAIATTVMAVQNLFL